MSDKVRFGPANPHPLSQLKTELVWEGKYDEYGNRRVVDIAGCAMPMQKIETIDELRSPRAVQVNIAIMRTFVRLREMLLSNTELARKLAALENKYDAQFKVVFDDIPC